MSNYMLQKRKSSVWEIERFSLFHSYCILRSVSEQLRGCFDIHIFIFIPQRISAWFFEKCCLCSVNLSRKIGKKSITQYPFHERIFFEDHRAGTPSALAGIKNNSCSIRPDYLYLRSLVNGIQNIFPFFVIFPFSTFLRRVYITIPNIYFNATLSRTNLKNSCH